MLGLSKLQNFLFFFLSLLTGSVFILSALLKLYPVEVFELTFVDAGVASWLTTPFIARLVIGLEFFLGLLLLFNLKLRGLTYKIVTGLLLFFTAYLLWQIILYGNKGNCHCFGTILPMTPLQAIIKNIVLLALVFLLARFYKGFALPFQKVFIWVFFFISFSLPFILNPVALNDTAANIASQKTGYKLPLHYLYNATPPNKKPSIDLREGKHIVAFMSLTCPHCKIAAFKFHLLKEKNKDLPLYFVLNGDYKDLKPFLEEAKISAIPYTLFKGYDFLKMSGPELPAIFLLQDGIVFKKVHYNFWDEKKVEQWLAAP